MEQLTLDQAAENFAPTIEGNGIIEGLNKIVNEAKQFGFKAGAEWQKEQYKVFANTFKDMLAALMSVDKYIYYKEECNGRGLGRSFPHPKHEIRDALTKAKKILTL